MSGSLADGTSFQFNRRATAARENGRKGGRPSGWSKPILAAAVACLRGQAESLANPLGQELLCLAQALENGTLYLRGRTARTASTDRTSTSVVPPVFTGPVDQSTRLELSLLSSRGQGPLQAIEERVLSRFQPDRLPGTGAENVAEYHLTVRHSTDNELECLVEELLNDTLSVARERRCFIDYDLRWVDRSQPAQAGRLI